MGTLREEQSTYVMISYFFLEWEIFKTNFVEKIKTHFMFSNFFFFSKIVPFTR
jgi:hypothetical protein